MTMQKKQIHLNAFAQNSVSPHAIGLWKHPKHEGSRHGDLDYWVQLAKLLEKGKFDTLFLADVLGIYDVYQGSYQTAIEQAVQVPAHDPLLIISAMAQATESLGFAVTASTTYSEPYKLARQFSTLDHITKGRIAWNIVTSYLESEAVNLGLKTRIEHDERYERADEFMDVVYKLWEKSWEDDAVIQDVEREKFADATKVHPIRHKGDYFHVPGIHLVEPSSQRTPVLFQAGASPRGREFAAKHAEAIFTDTQNSKNAVEELRRFSDDIRQRVATYGRNRKDIKIFPGLVPIVGSTEAEALEKYEYLKSLVDYDGALALLSGHTGVDLSVYDPDDYVEDMKAGAIQSTFQSYTSTNPKYKWTIKDAVLHHGLGAGSTTVVGTPEQIADHLTKLALEGGADGFNIGQTVIPDTLSEFIHDVVPELQNRGIYRKDYESSTLREHLFGKGQTTLKECHYGKSVTIQQQEKLEEV